MKNQLSIPSWTPIPFIEIGMRCMMSVAGTMIMSGQKPIGMCSARHTMKCTTMTNSTSSSESRK